MKKTYLLIPIIIVGLFIAYYHNKQGIIDFNIQENTQPTNTSVVSNEEENDLVVENLLEETIENPELLKYRTKGNSVAVYKAQKRFLSKTDEEIVGETTLVNGVADFNLIENKLDLYAEVDLSDLRSDNENRDSDVLKLFDPKTVKVTYSGTLEEEVFLNEENVTQLPLNITINGIEKEVPFDITYYAEQNAANIKGQASIKMSDFGVKPPSLLNVYTVDDEIELYFDVNFGKNQ